MRKFVLLLISMVSLMFAQCSTSSFTEYITAKEGKLMEGEKEFRFISCNIPNLHYNEDYLPFNEINPWRLPDEFEITDALTAIKQIGGRATRMYVISVKKEEDSPGIIRHVEAPGVFNEQAFKTLDKVLEVANKTGVRVIIPLVDNWWWWGGPKEYAAFRGKSAKDFWTDTLLISDFKKTIDYVLNRENSYTGVLYKDDMSILAWETGNELKCPFSWTREIAEYIKSIDKNHLVIDGASYDVVPKEAIRDTNIDVLTTHHYTAPKATIKNVIENKEAINGKKPYFVGEFGFIPKKDAEAIIDTVINNNIAGAMIWSLRFRNSEGGFYNHHESGSYSAYHWPGFKSGEPYEEKEVMSMIRKKAAEINKTEIEPLPIPAEPKLLDIKNVYEISWQGSTGATEYTIQRKDENGGGWIDIDKVDDATYVYVPQYADTSAKTGNEYSYRVIASNESGSSEPSNAFGPVPVNYYKLVDEMADFSKIYQKEGSLKTLVLDDVRKAKEDRSRVTGNGGSAIVYKTPGDINEIKVNVFMPDEKSDVEFFAGATEHNFEKLTVQKNIYAASKNDYGFFTPVTFSSKDIPAGTRYIKMVLVKKPQISRTEIKYGQLEKGNN